MMLFKQNIIFILKVIAVAILLIIQTPQNIYAVGEVVFIANTSVKTDSVSKSDIKDIFLGEKITWEDGSEIIVAILKDSPVHQIFTKNYLRKTPVQFFRFWRNKVFSGKGMMPEVVDSEKEMLHFVSNTKNAIGYISPEISKSGVKILNIR